MKLKKRFKKIASLLFALGMVFSTVQVPVTPVFAQDSLLQIDVSGSGTVLVTQDGKTKEVKEKAEIAGTAGETIHVAAKAAEGNQITAFAVFTDQDQKGLAFGDTADKECDVELGKEKYIAIDFGVPVDQPDGGIQLFASQADYDRLQPGASGSGQWWTSNQDMFAQLFPISWIHGDLEPFSQYIVGQNASCIDPGHIGITDNNAYGIKTLGYTYRVESRNNENITVYIESDYLRKADGTPAVGWSAELGRIDTYQRFALRVNIPVPYRTIHINLTKQSANPQLTNGNDCYSLAGAEYGVYSDPGCGSKIGMITTGGDGRGHVSIPNMNPSMNTVYIKELKPSKGYLLNPEVITVNLDGNGNGNAVSKETPGNDPLTIYLNKISEDGQYVQNVPSLEGAEFTVKYYDGQYTNVASLPASPTRSWVIKTTKNGTVYSASLDDAHKVSGDDFYTNEGHVTLPLGTVTVQETKAPAGYTVSGASYSVNNGTVNQADGVALFNIKEKGNGIFGMVGGNAYTVTEKVIRSGSFSMQKRDAETGDKPQGGTAGLSAKFKLTNNNDYGAVSKLNSNDYVRSTTLCINGSTKKPAPKNWFLWQG